MKPGVESASWLRAGAYGYDPDRGLYIVMKVSAVGVDIRWVGPNPNGNSRNLTQTNIYHAYFRDDRPATKAEIADAMLAE